MKYLLLALALLSFYIAGWEFSWKPAVWVEPDLREKSLIDLWTLLFFVDGEYYGFFCGKRFFYNSFLQALLTLFGLSLIGYSFFSKRLRGENR
jgi:hypothetical protein